MKYIILLSVIFFIYGCDEWGDMYPSKKEIVNTQSTPMAVDSEEGGKLLGYDTASIALKVYNCVYFKVKKPYYLIKWNDNTYGILWHDKYRDWYKAKNNDDYRGFSSTLEAGTHFKDSCEAKEDLQRYLDTKITYTIVK